MMTRKQPSMLAAFLLAYGITISNAPATAFAATPVLSATVSASTAKALPDNILGLRLNMTDRDAEVVLKKLGSKEREERRKKKREEIWVITNDQFSHVIVGFDSNGVRYITAVARAEAKKKMRYTDVFDTTQAQQRGEPQSNNFHYVWLTNGKNLNTEIVARGRDAQYLETFSLKRL